MTSATGSSTHPIERDVAPLAPGQENASDDARGPAAEPETEGARSPAGATLIPASSGQGARAPVFAPAVTLAWLVRVRWATFFAQAVAVVVANLALGVGLETNAPAAIVFLGAASNVVLHAWMRRGEPRVRHGTIGAVLVTDTVLLTAMLYFSGGSYNPFTALYLVYVTLAALALGIRWASAFVAIGAAGYLLLFSASAPVDVMAPSIAGGPAFSTHLHAMWIAFTVTAALIAFLVARLQRALRERDERLAQVWFVAARSEKLASLTTLAAGAAHELGTPLATIAVASKDLEKALGDGPAPSPLADDARLIRREVERCRWIVEQMSGRSGVSMGEALEVITVKDLETKLREKAAHPDRLVVEVDPEVTERLVVPVRGLLQSLGNLIANAQEASTRSADNRVVLSILRTDEVLRFGVIDHGAGIPESQLARAGEPFFSTRPPGKGMGLGLFLARAFAEEWRGRLDIDSKPGYGTRVYLELPSHFEGIQ